MKRLKTYVLMILRRIDRSLDRRLKFVTFPGFQKQSIYDVGKFFVKQLVNEDLNLRASSMAFNFFIAIFPAIIFLFTLTAYIPIDDLDLRIENIIDRFLPDGAFSFLQETITDIINNQQAGLLSFGFVAAIYFSSNGFASMLAAFDVGVERKLQRSWFNIRAKSAMLMFLVVSLILTIITLSITIGYSVSYLRESVDISDQSMANFLKVVEYLLNFILVYLIFSSVYFFGTTKGVKWKFFTPGSSLATILSLITTYGFTQYVENFNSYNKLYGSVGTLLVILLLIYFNSFVVLIGFELNRSVDKATLHDDSRLSLSDVFR